MNQEPEIGELKYQLLNKQRLNGEYMLYWGKAYETLKGTKVDNVLTAQKDPLAYIKTLPLELEANSQALLELLARNNGRILRLLELICNKPI